MRQNSDNPVPRVPKQEAQSGLSLASFGLYIYLLSAQRPSGSTFRHRSSRITIAQAASETRGN